MSAVLPVFFAWTGTGRHGDDPVSTVSPAHTSPSLPPSESEPPLYLGVCVYVCVWVWVCGWVEIKRNFLNDVPYSEKLSREKTFTDFSLLLCQRMP